MFWSDEPCKSRKKLCSCFLYRRLQSRFLNGLTQKILLWRINFSLFFQCLCLILLIRPFKCKLEKIRLFTTYETVYIIQHKTLNFSKWREIAYSSSHSSIVGFGGMCGWNCGDVMTYSDGVRVFWQLGRPPVIAPWFYSNFESGITHLIISWTHYVYKPTFSTFLMLTSPLNVISFRWLYTFKIGP